MDVNIINQVYSIFGLDIWEHAFYLKLQRTRQII
ncbi:Fe-Mn family superoxide dismutase [Flagellimonas yonaguniensis]